MQLKIELSGDFHEDTETFNIFSNAQNLYYANTEALQLIRDRLKHGEDISNEEEKILEELREVLWIQGLS